MARIVITIDPSIDGRVISALARHYSWNPEDPACQGKTKKQYIAECLRIYLIKLARQNEIDEAVGVAAADARAAAEAAAGDLDMEMGE